MELRPLVIRWHESDLHRYHWFIRGLRSDGSYYGEVRSTFDKPRDSDGLSGIARSVEGKLSTDDIKRVLDLAARIREQPSPDTDLPVVGVLADGPVGDPTVLYRHSDSAASEFAMYFVEIIAILRPHLAYHYPSLGQSLSYPTVTVCRSLECVR